MLSKDFEASLEEEDTFINGQELLQDQNEYNADVLKLASQEDIIKEASKSAHSKNTRRDYGRNWANFLLYIEDEYGEEEQGRVISCTTSQIPVYIAYWIYIQCDPDAFSKDSQKSSLPTKNLAIEESSSSPKKRKIERSKALTYSSATVLRSAISYGFGVHCKRGQGPWTETAEGFLGNPSLSSTVMTYMRSLRRKKIALGEVAISVRSITSADIHKLWEINRKVDPVPYGTKSSNFDSSENYCWGGYRERTMMHCIYVLSFLCLLRFDEVLSIEAHHLEVKDKEKGIIMLHLPSRKTHQTGEIRPFGLRWNREKPWLDPVDAVLRWIEVSQIKEGFIFRRIDQYDRVTSPNKPLGPDQFLVGFQHNLLDVGIDFRTYGTHSFRRGGCQYFASELRWQIRKICDWGGWSTTFNNLTIVQYLMGWNDEPVHPREDFLDPTVKGISCSACGRSCLCA